MNTQNSIMINEKEILIFSENGENYIAIKPICEALGVGYDNQIEKINADGVLSELTPLRGATGSDGKTYNMRVIPYKYVFGWLFTINVNNIKAEARNALIKYKIECYNALFDHFTNRSKMMARKAEKLYELRSLQNKLAANEDYQKMIELKEEISKISRDASTLDRTEIDMRLNLFNNDTN